MDDRSSSRARDFNCYYFSPSRTFLAAKHKPWRLQHLDHSYFTLSAGDRDLMEGVSSEAASIRSKVCKNLISWLFFMIQNDINLDGETKDSNTETERTNTMFHGWHTALLKMAPDSAIHAAIETVKLVRFILIEVRRLLTLSSKQTRN